MAPGKVTSTVILFFRNSPTVEMKAGEAKFLTARSHKVTNTGKKAFTVLSKEIKKKQGQVSYLQQQFSNHHLMTVLSVDMVALAWRQVPLTHWSMVHGSASSQLIRV